MTEPWFKPKAYGYGAQPANWKGWLATIAYAAAVVAIAFAVFANRGDHPTDPLALIIWFALVGSLTLAFVAFAKAKTSGDWRWRWGKSNKP